MGVLDEQKNLDAYNPGFKKECGSTHQMMIEFCIRKLNRQKMYHVAG
jgi:hypothetical protein